MNSEMKMVLLPFEEYRRRINDEQETKNNYTKVITSKQRNTVKNRILKDILNKYMARQNKSKEYLEDMFKLQKTISIPIKRNKKTPVKKREQPKRAAKNIKWTN